MRFFLLLLLTGTVGWPQRKPPIASQFPNFPQPPLWQPIARAAGMIFSGSVLQVDRAANATGTTQITFRVEHAIRGVQVGQIVQISEWGGLWNTDERYSKGERVLLFLYPRSRLGLTSPVGGRTGRFAVDSSQQVLITSPQFNRPHPVPLKTIRAQIARSSQE